MPTVKEAIANASLQLRQAGVESAELDASLLMAHVLGTERAQLLLFPDKPLNDMETTEYGRFVARRLQHEPIAYIIGKKEFWSLDFRVTRDTLIPRPDSETLVEAALRRVRNFTEQTRAKSITLLDIGTGTACLLIALLTELRDARGTGVDISEPALQVARENARRHGVETRAQFIQSHWCDAINGTFDLILSNPPYITEGAMSTLMPDVVQFEPRSALVAGADGLDAYRALAPQVAMHLRAGGYALFEVGQGQADDVAQLLSAEGLTIDGIEKDFAGTARCVVARQMNNNN